MAQVNKGLKASKIEAHKASKVENVLSDNVKLTLAPIVGDGSKAFDLYAKSLDASLAYQDSEKVFADNLYTYLDKAKPDYPQMQAIKKHIFVSLAHKTRKPETVEKWFSSFIMPALKELGFVPPKSESKAAQGMSELRKELASIETELLQESIEAAAQVGDFKKAARLAAEKKSREAKAQRAIEKAESKHTRELKADIKTWISGMSVEQLAALVWAKNNFAQVEKLAFAK